MGIPGVSDGAIPVPSMPPIPGTLSNNDDGSLTYTPEPGFTGEVSFQYTVKDDQGTKSNLATIAVTITLPNLVPVANDDEAQANTEESVTINLISNDTDADGNDRS